MRDWLDDSAAEQLSFVHGFILRLFVAAQEPRSAERDLLLDAVAEWRLESLQMRRDNESVSIVLVVHTDLLPGHHVGHSFSLWELGTGVSRESLMAQVSVGLDDFVEDTVSRTLAVEAPGPDGISWRR